MAENKEIIFLGKKRECPEGPIVYDKEKDIDKEKQKDIDKEKEKDIDKEKEKDIDKEKEKEEPEKKEQTPLKTEKINSIEKSDISENDINNTNNSNNSNSEMKIEKEKETDKDKDKEKQKKPKPKKKSEMTRDEIIIKEIRKKQTKKNLTDLIQKGFANFAKKEEYDFFLFNLIKSLSISLDNFKDFKEDFTYYIYNNLRVLILSKELSEALKKITYNPENETLYKEFLNFTKGRWDKFIKSAEEYNIKLLEDYKKSILPEEKKLKQNLNSNKNNNNNGDDANNNTSNNNTTNTTSNTTSTSTNNTSTNANNNNTDTPQGNNNENKEAESEKFDMNKTIEAYRNFPEDNQLEIMVAGVVYNSLLKIDKDLPKEVKLNDKDKNSISPTVPTKVEIQNFNLPEMPMVSVISGIKFYPNITEINLSGNSLSPKSCFCLGSVVKTNPNLLVLDISRCNLDNDRLYMFIEGTKFSNEKYNKYKEQFNLERLNLKDNAQIDDTIKEGKQHPIALILERFKLKWINLTNAKLNGTAALQLTNKMEELLEQKKLFLENLILICNGIRNEECLGKLGDILLKENCPLKNIILSKNLISSPILPKLPENPGEKNNENYFKKFMECVGKSQLKELFLISCEIGSNENDVDILYNMLKENKSLITIRLFGNKISQMTSFTKILGIFSDYNKPLENSTLKSLDLSKNSCNIKIDEEFMKLVEHLKLEYLDVNQNMMEANEKEIFKKRTNELSNIKIIY